MNGIMLRRAGLCLATLMVGCGGDSKTAATIPTIRPSIPEQVVFFDPATGEPAARATFDYQTPLEIRSVFLGAGEDGILDTEDDVASDYLTCQYMPVDHVRGPRPILLLAGMAGTPTGQIFLEEFDLPDGQRMRCPPLASHAVTLESFCSTAGCPLPPKNHEVGYRVTREVLGTKGRAIETHVMALLEAGVSAEEFGEAQQADVWHDSAGREERVIIQVTEPNPAAEAIIDTCTDGENFAVHLILMRRCSSIKVDTRFQYDMNARALVTEVFSGLTAYSSLTSVRSHHRTERTLSLQRSEQLIAASTPEPRWIDHYTLNRRGHATESSQRLPGTDGLFFTEDDTVEAGTLWSYRNGNLLTGILDEFGVREAREYDERNRLLAAHRYTGEPNPAQTRVEFDYEGMQPVRQRVYETLAGYDGLVLRSETTLQPALPRLPANFSATGVQVVEAPDIDTLMAKPLYPF